MEFRTMLENAALKTGSQRALAAALGEPEQHVSNAKNGKRGLKDESCAALADLLGLSFGEVIAARNYALAKSEKDRQFWSPFVMGRKAASFTAISAAIGLLTTAPSPAEAGTARFYDNSTGNFVHYVKYHQTYISMCYQGPTPCAVRYAI